MKKVQVLFLIALLCSSAFCQLTGTVPWVYGDTGNTYSTPVEFRIGYFNTNECAIERESTNANIVDPAPFLYTVGSTAAANCVPKTIVPAGSYAWAIFQSGLAGLQLIDSRTSRSGQVTEYTTRTASPPLGTIFALRFDASVNPATFGKIVEGYQLYTKDAAGAPQGITTFTSASGCRNHLLLQVTTTANTNFLLNEAGERSQVSGADVYLGINTRTGAITAYPSGADPCDAIEALVEEEEDSSEEKSAQILSVAALAALGVMAI